MILDGIHPVGDGLPGFVSTETIQPVRVLGTPHKSMELEVSAVVLCPVKCSITTTPVEFAASAFDRSPLTFVFCCNLVPELRKVATNLGTSCNVTDELGCSVG